MEKEEAKYHLEQIAGMALSNEQDEALTIAMRALEQREKPKDGVSEDETIRLIKGRILDEWNKHPKLDWAEIAARKLYSQWNEFYQFPCNNSNGEVKSAEDVLKKHWETVTALPFNEITRHHLNYVINAMHEYHNQFPSVKQSPYPKMMMVWDSYEDAAVEMEVLYEHKGRYVAAYKNGSVDSWLHAKDI